MSETKVVHCMKEPYDVYIGRRNPKVKGYESKDSDWCNPFKLSYKADRDEVCKQYKTYLLYSPRMIERLPELVGKTLGCWCHPQKCHGDMIIEVMKERKLI